MRHTIILLICFIFLCRFTAHAQEFGTAIVLDSADISTEYGDYYARSIRSVLRSSGGHGFEYYTWNKNDDDPKLYKPNKNSIYNEKPITAVAYIESNLSGFDKLSMYSRVDTTGKVTGYYLKCHESITPKYKIIDLTTGEIISIENKSTSSSSSPILINNYKSIAKTETRPEKLKESDYKRVLTAVKRRLHKNIEKTHEQSIYKAVESFSKMSRTLRGRSDTRLWSILDRPSVDSEEKIKSFWINGTSAENIKKNELLTVYAKRRYGMFEVYDQLTLAGVVTQEVSNEGTRVKTNVYNRKIITDAIKDGLEIVIARNAKLVMSSNVDIDKFKRVQVKGNCIFCNSSLESMLAKMPNVILIERKLDPVRDYFVAQYTDERFVDFDMSKIQGKTVGADYIFEKTKQGLQATNVSTGRIEKVDHNSKKGIIEQLKTGGVSSADIINLSLNILDEKIDLIEITKAKKGKAKKVQLYSPMGFASCSKIKVVKEIEEEVGGRALLRQEEVGIFTGRKDITQSIKSFKVKSGEKSIYEAVQSGEPLKYILLK